LDLSTAGCWRHPGGLVVSGDDWAWTPRPSDLIVEDPLMVAVRAEIDG
jgi:hypothetical protein